MKNHTMIIIAALIALTFVSIQAAELTADEIVAKANDAIVVGMSKVAYPLTRMLMPSLSRAIEIDAWHHRSDALSSVPVLAAGGVDHDLVHATPPDRRIGDDLVGQVQVLHFTVQVLVVGRHVEVAVSAQVEQDRPALPGFLRLLRLADGGRGRSDGCFAGAEGGLIGMVDQVDAHARDLGKLEHGIAFPAADGDTVTVSTGAGNTCGGTVDRKSVV